jgi:general secretion pathway protein G
MKPIPASSRSAFTLMEIMLVVAIIAVLAGLLIYNQFGALETGSEVAARANMNTLKMNLVTYRMNAGHFPTTEQGLKALTAAPSGGPRPISWKKIIDEVPLDPWGREFLYENPGRKNSDTFDLYSAGRDGKPGTEDDVWPN